MATRRERREIDRKFLKAQKRGKVKNIRYEATFLTPDGQPFIIPDPDVRKQKEKRDEARKEGKERYDLPTIEADFAQAMIWFMNNLPYVQDEDEKPRRLTTEDTGNGYAVIKAFQDIQGDIVTLEESTYRWLVDINKSDGPLAFRMTQGEVTKRLEDLVKDDP